MTNLDLTKTVSIRIRRDISSNWSSKNPILKVGEPGLETDTRKLKFGDGTTRWNNLPYSGIDINDSNLLENIDDRVASLIKAGSNITINYNDDNNELVISATGLQLAGNYATLIDGKIPAAQLPSYVDDVLEFANFSALPASGETSKIYVALDNNKVYRWGGSSYVEVSASPGSTDSIPEGSVNKYYTDSRAGAAAPVQSVAGKTGTVTLTKNDVGLSNVDNTSDLDKPISTATQTALNNKANLNHNHNTLYRKIQNIILGFTVPSPITAEKNTEYVFGEVNLVGPYVKGNFIINDPASASQGDGYFVHRPSYTMHNVVVGGVTYGSSSPFYIYRHYTLVGLSFVWKTVFLSPIQSVAGKTGDVTLTKNDVSLNNVDNTSDLNKPISTATQTALDGKANSSHTHDDRYYTESEVNTLLSSKLSESTDRYIVCKSGDDILSKYAAAKLLTPGENALSTNNRAYLIVTPGVYPLSAQWEIDAEFVDVIGLGSSSLERGCNVAVTVTGYDINVSANNVRIKGIGTTSDRAFKIDGNKPLQVFEECVGGDGSFSITNEFGVQVGDVSGTFTNCVGGDYSFGGGGVTFNTASGRFTNCSAGDFSFGGTGLSSGTFANCSGGDYSFSGVASGTFTNCSGGNYSFGGWASGTFTNCTGGDYSFGVFGTASGSFTNCSGGDVSFGTGNGASGIFVNCSGGLNSFGSGANASGSFKDCTGGGGSFGGDWGLSGDGCVASGSFVNCTGGDFSFGGGGGTASGSFVNCVGRNNSFGGGGTASGKLLRCTLTTGTFQTLSGNGKYRLCIDGNYDVINADAPPPPPRTLYFNGAVNDSWATLGNWWNDAGFTIPATSLPTSADSVLVFASITNTGSEPTVANLTATDASFDMNITVTGAASFVGALSGAALASGRTLTGNATFTGDGYALAPAGNDGTVAGNATFVGIAGNQGTVTGNATFTGEYNADAWAINSGTVTGNATFNTHSRNNGTVAGTATFNDSACNNGGTAGTFVPDPPPSCSPPTPTAPGPVAVVQAEERGCELETGCETYVVWDAPVSNGGSPITGYRVYAIGTPPEIPGGLLSEVGAEASSVTIPGQICFTGGVEVCAVNAVGEGPRSAADPCAVY